MGAGGPETGRIWVNHTANRAWRALCAFALASATLAGQDRWTRIVPGHGVEFPRDHGSHPDCRTEWWYVTGNLSDPGGRRFGYQLTLFRRGLGDGPREGGGGSPRPGDVWAGHLVLVDVERGETRLAERLRRGSSSLVRAARDGLDLALEDWSLARDPDGTIELAAADPASGIGLALELAPSKPLVLHGAAGVSSKGFEPGNASAYATWTRLTTRGSVELDDELFEVEGASWLDHEWGSGQLGEGVVGWDWFGLRVDDGRELMVYGLRHSDGSAHPLSGGTLVERDGTAAPLALADFAIEVTGQWESPHTGARYPARWRILVPSAGLDLEARPLVADCELDTRSTDVVYWEGPVELTAPGTGRVLGRGYAELVGYAHGMQGRF